MKKTKLLADVAVLGGGAAGMAAAICAKSNHNRVLLIEKEPRVGKKLLSTGNGRCNLSNERISSEFYFGTCKAEEIFQKYDAKYIKSFFRSLGLLTKSDEEGRIYPYSNQAGDVLNVLRLNLERLGVTVLTSTSVKKIKKADNKFILDAEDTTVSCKCLIVTTGGISSCKANQDETGFSLLDGLGIRRSPLFPSLAPVKVSTEAVRPLKGIRTHAKVFLADGKKIFSEHEGEVQFTDGALSGICVFQLSRLVNEYFSTGQIGGAACRSLTIRADFLPELTFGQAEEFLKEKRILFPDTKLEYLFTGLLNNRLGQFIIKKCKLSLPREIKTLSNHEIKAITAQAKNFAFEPIQSSNFSRSQVTAGGITADEINFSKLETKKIKNLFLAGEVLDIDGLCGGYNLHWAWTSGIIAGKAAKNSTNYTGTGDMIDTHFKS